MLVKDAMTPRLVVVDRKTALDELAALLDDADIDVAVVLDPTFTPLPGIITDRDIRRAVADGRDPATTTVSEYLTHQVRRALPDDDLDDALVRMIVAGHHHLLVLVDGQVRSVVSEADILRAVMLAGGPTTVTVTGREVANQRLAAAG